MGSDPPRTASSATNSEAVAQLEARVTLENAELTCHNASSALIALLVGTGHSGCRKKSKQSQNSKEPTSGIQGGETWKMYEDVLKTIDLS